MTLTEAMTIAEEQADCLLALSKLHGPPVPFEIVSDIPRMHVVLDPNLPVSGTSHWNGVEWVIVLNRSESRERRRFTLMHEFKHILDHGREPVLAPPRQQWRDADERVADYFAGCLLMPRLLLENAWTAGTREPTTLARTFEVSITAMTYRLRQLDLLTNARHEPLDRHNNERRHV